MDNVSVDQISVLRARRRVYGRDFKLQVVRRVTEGCSVQRLMQELGITSSMVSRWMQEWRRDPAQAFRGHGQRKSFQDQIERLRRQVSRLRTERDLLKKASGRFASMPNIPSASLQSIERCGPLDGCARFSVSRVVDITTGSDV